MHCIKLPLLNVITTTAYLNNAPVTTYLVLVVYSIAVVMKFEANETDITLFLQ